MTLNVPLYNALQRAFKKVKVTRPNQPIHGNREVRIDPVTGKARVSLRTVPGGSGEEYLVCCPFCNDRRFRLSINHRWGVYDPQLKSRNLHLAICYNEDCLSNSDNRWKLWQIVSLHMTLDAAVTLPPAEAVLSNSESEIKEVSPPGLIKPLASLPESHPAVQYVRHRGFDERYLTEVFQIGYVVDSDQFRYVGRLYVPIFFRGKLSGWQLRTIANDQPRWYTCPGMPKSCLLYNADNALPQDVKILVEGASSCWAVGIQGLAAFGKTVSTKQFSLINESMSSPDSRLILMLDPDPKPARGEHHIDAAYRASQLFPNLRGKVIVVWLPEGKDPADFTPRHLREYILRAVDKQLK